MSRAIVDTFAGVDGRGCYLTKRQPISKTCSMAGRSSLPPGLGLGTSLLGGATPDRPIESGSNSS